jgi:PhnB protein
MNQNTYVNFAGCCKEALHYYEQHLGGRVTALMTHGQAPDQSRTNPDWKDLVLHSRMEFENGDFMAADIPHAEPMRSAYLTLTAASDEEAERVFKALSDGGQVFMPMQETFFATRFGQARDRFGINWMVLRERPMRDPG